MAETDGSSHIDCVRAVGTVVVEQYCCCIGIPSDGAVTNIVAAALQALGMAVAAGPAACKAEDGGEEGGKNSPLPSWCEAC